MGFKCTDGIHVEPVDDGFLVLTPGADEVLQVEGDAAAAFEVARSGALEVPAHLASAMAGLVELGVVQTDVWSRRRVLQLGGSVAAAGVAVIALPSVAAAASGGGSPTTSPPAPVNLVTNPSFEDGAAYATPPSWTIG